MSYQSWGRWLAAVTVLILLQGNAQAQFPTDYLFGDHITGTDFTIAGWFRASQAQTTDVAIISNKNWGSGGNPGYVLTAQSINGGATQQWKVNANGVGGTRADTDWVNYNLNDWVFIAATFDRDGNVTAFTNGGSLAGGNTNSRLSPTGLIDTANSPNFFDFNIGQDGTGNYDGGQGFNGLIDDVGVWRRALTADEVAGLYTQGTSGNSLGSLFGQSLNGGANLIDQGLVGYYGFESNLNDGAGTPQNGIPRLAGGAAGTVAFSGGRFGQALSLNGGNYVTIGKAPSPPADATFTGNSPLNNLASNAQNWDLAPSLLTVDQGIIVASGTSAVFSGANTGPAIFNSSFPRGNIKNFVFGGAGQTTFIEFDGTVNLVGVGATPSTIGTENSTVNLTMRGSSRLDHRGAGEEQSRLFIGLPGSTVNLTLNDSSELAAGPKVPDPTYATGFRRPISTDPPGTPPRTGDDILLGDRNNLAASQINLTMNQNSTMFVADVLYPGDSNNTVVNVVQNGNSRVIANWDTRWLDDGHTTEDGVNWTMNGQSQFLVARDHGLGETGGSGFVNLTINDDAYFFAGDRIALGADGGNINVVMNGGRMKVGGNAPTDVLLVDNTGEGSNPPTSAGSPALDWILHMGGGANANLTVNAGTVEIGRSAFIGRGGGTARVVVNGGTFNVKGVAPIGIGLGNSPGGGVPGSVNWASSGGDVIIGDDAGDSGRFEFVRGNVTVARDFIVSYDNTPASPGGGNGVLQLTTSTGTNAFTVGRDLSFGGDFFGPSLGNADFEVVFNGGNLTPVTVNGDLYVFNTSGTTSEFSLSVAPGALPPTVGQYVLIDYAGSRFGDTFTQLPATGITYNLIYDNANSRVLLDILNVTLIDGDFNNDGLFNCADVDSLVGVISTGSNTASFDLTADGVVNSADLNAWLAQAGAVNLPSGNPYRTGDANLDGVVDGSDFGIWNSNKFTSSPRWCGGDFNADGVVDGSDFGLWNSNKFTSSDAATSMIPEPVLGGWLVIGLAALAASRRRRG